MQYGKKQPKKGKKTAASIMGYGAKRKPNPNRKVTGGDPVHGYSYKN